MAEYGDGTAIVHSDLGTLCKLLAAAMVAVFAGVVIWSTMLGLFLATTWSDWIPLFLAIPVVAYLLWDRRVLARLADAASRIPLSRIVGLGLLLRVTWAVFSQWQPCSDALDYEQMAMDILHGDWSLNASKAKGTSYFLALHYALFGVRYLPPMLTQSVLSALQIWFVHDIVVAAGGGTRSAKLAAALLAVWPESVLYCDVLGSDTLFSFLVLFAAWMARNQSAIALWSALAAGAVLGWAHWVRPTGLLFLLATGATMVIVQGCDGRLWRGISRTVAVAAGASLPIGLIVGLNLCSFGCVSLSPSQMGGSSLLLGSNIETAGRWNESDANWCIDELPRETVPPGMYPAVYRDRRAKEKGWERIRANPIAFAACVLTGKMYNLWGAPATLSWPLFTSRLEDFMKVQWVMAVALLHYAIAALLLVRCVGRSAWGAVARSPALFQLLLAALVTSAAHCLLEVQPRYHFAFVPLWAMLLAIGFSSDDEPPGGPANN